MYKIGDKVHIRKDIDIYNGWRYPGGFVRSMIPFIGKVLTICKIERMCPQDASSEYYYYNGDPHFYFLEEDLQRHYWSSSMFEPVYNNIFDLEVYKNN